MAFVVAVSVILQLYYVFTGSIWWLNGAEDGVLFNRRTFEANFLEFLAVAKVVTAPVSFVLLAANPRWGKLFTGGVFLAYGLSGYAMPFIAESMRPMAWWPNTRSAGEGPFMSLLFLALGVVLLFHERIAKPKRPAEVSTPDSPSS
jgi:hypothetical protein